jgi:3-deoxy-D-manno-octulosonic-acid transferase
MVRILYFIISSSAPFLLRIISFFSKKIDRFREIQIKANNDLQLLETWRNASPGKLFWIHCASLGEFEQGRPIIEKVKSLENPPIIALTFFSSSGYEIRKNYPLADWVGYLPLDHPINSQKFVKLLQPSAAVFVKYEFWPYYILALKNLRIPFYAVSVIFRKEHFILKSHGAFFRKCIENFTKIFLQNQSSFELLQKQGFKKIEIAGDTRFDTVIKNRNSAKDLNLIKIWKGSSPLFVAGSTWPADEEVILPLLEKFPTLKIILVPHEIHQEELEKIKTKFDGLFYEELNEDLTEKRLLIINKIGLLSSIYQYGTFAYIGGAFGKGLHNTLEAATYGLPIFFGNKNYSKFQEALDLIELNVAENIDNQLTLEKKIEILLQNPELIIVKKRAALQYISQNGGATDLIIKYLKTHFE